MVSDGIDATERIDAVCRLKLCQRFCSERTEEAGGCTRKQSLLCKDLLECGDVGAG